MYVLIFKLLYHPEWYLHKVTALMHGDRDPSIAAMVLDSPFADLTRLCEEMVDKARDQGINVPGFVSSVAIRMIRGSVRRQADFDIRDVSPIAHVPHCYIPHYLWPLKMMTLLQNHTHFPCMMSMLVMPT